MAPLVIAAVVFTVMTTWRRGREIVTANRRAQGSLEERLTVDDLGHAGDGIQHLSVRFGFFDTPDLPQALRQACADGVFDDTVHDIADASYFVSRGSLRRTRQPGMRGWRKALFIGLAHNAANPAAYFSLMVDRTVP